VIKLQTKTAGGKNLMAIDFLNVCKHIRQQITIEQDKLKQLRSLVTSLTNNLDGLPRSNSPASKVEKLAAAIIDGENKIKMLTKILNDCIADLADKIFAVISNTIIRAVILYRYGYCKTFKSIATELGFCERQIYKFHSAGLSILKKFSSSSVTIQ
jgi:hypothetical protein